MRIRYRLALFLVVSITLISMMAVYAGVMQNKSFKRLNTIYLSSENLIRATEQIDNHFQKQLLSWSNLLLKGLNPEKYYSHLQEFYEQERKTRTSARLLQGRMSEYPEAQASTLQFASLHARLGLNFRKAIKIYNQSDNPVYETDEYLGNITEKPVSLLKQVKESLVNQQKLDVEIAEREYKQNLKLIIFFAAITTLSLIAVFIWLLDISVGRPLVKTIDYAKQVSSGNYQLRVPENMPGEFNVFAKAFNHMLDRLSLVNKNLEEKKKAAEQASRAKSEFLSNVSHEIRTPLNIVTGYTELLSKTDIDNNQERYLVAIQDGADSLLRIIDDVLDLAKIESGRLNIEYNKFNLYQFMHSIESSFAPVISKKGLEFKLIITDDVPEYIVLDEYRLKQIAQNLMSNAIKFTESGNICLTVDVKETDNPTHKDLIIEVVDTGVGIPADYHDKVFDQFVQRDGQDSRKYGGTGLGLAICQKLAGMLNGIISLESEPGAGSTFRLKLVDVEVQSANTEEKHAINLSVQFDQAIVLIADDTKANRELVKEFLKEQPFTYYEAENGLEAVELAKQYCPDIIFMDIKMPEMDGVEATTLIKKNATLATIPVVALTAASIKGKLAQERELLFDDYLIKPVKINSLLNSMKKFLNYQDKTIS
ncbi:MAG: hypothetical protein DIZ80_09360 [endosymbiont of Galathealinum brachiosum]|uniref:Sensory/regulatory protein RpfC n=1 Tax=endosymbiont of Galathealinum brachiosum TaxID=2200906 RepID=A0A370DC70_9GAMM|nr:MAG: hypothetical protein DIZ80_09360 [endosymbiont of Galathealinum brachiosum]